jgi:hypothetical protein
MHAIPVSAAEPAYIVWATNDGSGCKSACEEADAEVYKVGEHPLEKVEYLICLARKDERPGYVINNKCYFGAGKEHISVTKFKCMCKKKQVECYDDQNEKGDN